MSILVHNKCDDVLNKWHKGTFADSEASLQSILRSMEQKLKLTL